MQRPYRFVWLLGMLLTIAVWNTLIISARPSGKAGYAPGIILVGFKHGVSEAEKRAFSPDSTELPGISVAQVHVAPGEELQTIASLRRDPRISFAELDYAVQAQDAAPTLIPDDPDLEYQWSLEKISAPAAWSIVTGTQQVIIAILDSGVQLNHPDLASKIWTNPGEIPGNQIDDDSNGKIDDVHGWHFFHQWNGNDFDPAEDAQVQDDLGHGTHVAGIAAAATDNTTGIAGISWGARLMPVKVLDEYGVGWNSDIAAGIVYAADNGARIINLSLGGEQDSQTIDEAINYALTRNVLVVAAAGNQDNAVLYPAAYDPVVAVAATDINDQRASYSNYGPQIDLAAPGSDIYSTWYRSNYIVESGTSMAAPHVSGVAALLWSVRPNLTTTEVISTLEKSAEDTGSPGFDLYTGWGRLNAYRAVASLTPSPDLWISLEAPKTAKPGETITYTIRYGNFGGAEAPGVWITDTLPVQISAAATTGWEVGSLVAGSGPFSTTLPLQAPDLITEITNRITITTTGVERNQMNNYAQANTFVAFQYFFPIVTGKP